MTRPFQDMPFSIHLKTRIDNIEEMKIADNVMAELGKVLTQIGDDLLCKMCNFTVSILKHFYLFNVRLNMTKYLPVPFCHDRQASRTTIIHSPLLVAKAVVVVFAMRHPAPCTPVCNNTIQ